ncbi:MAG: AAA family ATPase [Saprospiraceae bacterium]
MRLITHIKASNLLSFGPDGLDLELRDLNVLIGPNGSGKSNFLEVFEVLKSLPRNEEDSNNLQQVISRGGGKSEWIWKGSKDSKIILDTTLQFPGRKIIHKIHLNLLILASIEEEFISADVGLNGIDIYKKEILYNPKIRNIGSNKLEEIDFNSDLSVLSQRNNAVTNLVNSYEKIRLYREWSFGRNTIFRTPQRADQRNDRLESDFSNLGMVLSRLRKDPVTKRALITGLKDLYEGLTDFEVVIEGGTVQIFFTEGDFSIPATRLSDGTLRYLCLLAILLDPTPPPLICIEEPELGLHPDVMPKIADLLIEASKRTQLIVTTHSDVLIDALSEQPESVLVCEKHDGQTQIKRLEKEDIAHWLKDYSLGQLWTRGEIGGNRW